jgi:hypothetical protein
MVEMKVDKRNSKGKFVKGNSIGGAFEGNQNGVKLKDPDVRQRAYKSYCDWLSMGRSKEGWKFQSDELSCTHKTMEKYIAADPSEFPPITKEMAEADSFHIWEQRGMSMLLGEMKAETALYQMFMRNKFGWDKEEKSDSTISHAEKVLDYIMGRKDK